SAKYISSKKATSCLPLRRSPDRVEQRPRDLLSRLGGDIRADDLPAEIRRRAPRRQLTPLERIECDAIVTAIERAGGNKSLAADSLGISRSTLYRKVRTYGLELRNNTF
ncbi:helix-turn-helix domain-containing protein, partial [Pseudonocardia sp.]|uniref:helix-turn-helix domain-containing protein n=1 Tax=Pseudonocardia sp. TaxID=60912 RepID=UPI0031FC137B